MATERIVAMGAPAGGVRALQALASQLPVDFGAPIVLVQHIGNNQGLLPQLLTRAGPCPPCACGRPRRSRARMK